MVEKIFLGAETPGTSGMGTSPVHRLSHYTCLFTGKLTRVGIYSILSGNAKLNIYDVVAGSPTDLLYADDNGLACLSDAWNTKNISNDITVISGNVYAIGSIVDAASVMTNFAETRDRSFKTDLNYATFTAPDPLTGQGYTDEADHAYTYAYVAYGIEVPIISNIDELYGNGKNKILTGTSFMDSDEPLTLELCNDSVYGSASIKVPQPINIHDDESINFDVELGTLGNGLAYAFVTTSMNQRSAAYAVNVKRTYEKTVWAVITNDNGERSRPYPITMRHLP